MSFLNTPGRKIAATVAGVIVLAAVVIGVLLATADGDTAGGTKPDATPVANGVPRPDASCVTTDGTDRREYWDGNGWWAGRVDGELKEMPALTVLGLKLKGHQINSVWICAPRSNN